MNAEEYKRAFETIVNQQLARIEKMKTEEAFVDYRALDKIVIGVIIAEA